jgi:hypothetical protein
MRRRRGHGHQYNTLVIPNVMKYTIVQDGRTNTILLFTINVNRQNSGQKTKGRTTELQISSVLAVGFFLG